MLNVKKKSVNRQEGKLWGTIRTFPTLHCDEGKRVVMDIRKIKLAICYEDELRGKKKIKWIEKKASHRERLEHSINNISMMKEKHDVLKAAIRNHEDKRREKRVDQEDGK